MICALGKQLKWVRMSHHKLTNFSTTTGPTSDFFSHSSSSYIALHCWFILQALLDQLRLQMPRQMSSPPLFVIKVKKNTIPLDQQSLQQNPCMWMSTWCISPFVSCCKSFLVTSTLEKIHASPPHPPITVPRRQYHPHSNTHEPLHERVWLCCVYVALLQRFKWNRSDEVCFLYTDTSPAYWDEMLASLNPACVLCRVVGQLMNSTAGSTKIGDLKPRSLFPQHNMPLRTDRFQNSLFSVANSVFFVVSVDFNGIFTFSEKLKIPPCYQKNSPQDGWFRIFTHCKLNP